MYHRDDDNNTIQFASTTVMDVVASVLESLDKARRKFNPMNSAHEGHSVLREEVDELNDGLRAAFVKADQIANEIDRAVGDALWRAVKADDYEACMSEARHVAAMALRFLIDVPGCLGTKWRTKTDAGVETLVPTKCPDCDVYLLDVRTHNDKGPRGMCPKCRREWSAWVNMTPQTGDLKFRPDAFKIAMEPLGSPHPEHEFLGVNEQLTDAGRQLDHLDRQLGSALATIEALQKENITLREQLEKPTRIVVTIDPKAVTEAMLEAFERDRLARLKATT